MNPYRVVIHDGSTNTHIVIVRARSHEEAETQALIIRSVPYDAVVRMEVTPL